MVRIGFLLHPYRHKSVWTPMMFCAPRKLCWALLATIWLPLTGVVAQEQPDFIIPMDAFLNLPETSLLEQEKRESTRSTLSPGMMAHLPVTEAVRPTLRSCLEPIEADATSVDLTNLDWSNFRTTDEMEICIFRVATLFDGPDDIEGWLSELGMTSIRHREIRLSYRNPNSDAERPIGIAISGGYGLRHGDRWAAMRTVCKGRQLDCVFAYGFSILIVWSDGQIRSVQAGFSYL